MSLPMVPIKESLAMHKHLVATLCSQAQGEEEEVDNGWRRCEFPWLGVSTPRSIMSFDSHGWLVHCDELGCHNSIPGASAVTSGAPLILPTGIAPLTGWAQDGGGGGHCPLSLLVITGWPH